MAEQPQVSYGKSNISLKTLPNAGENVNVFLRPGDELHSSINLTNAQYQIVGTDVIATLPTGGKITFIALGMMAFEENPPMIKLPDNSNFDVGQILNLVQNISQTSKDAILVSGKVIIQNDEEKSEKEIQSKSEDEIPKDYNAYYVDPQPNIKPQDEIGPKDESGKYLSEPVEFTSSLDAVDTSSHKADSTESQSKSQDNIADVSAALSFDVGFYQIKAEADPSFPTTNVLGGTGSALGNVSKLAAAQFQAETLDYRNNPTMQVITVDNPNLVTDTYLTKLVRMNVSQPVGFGITSIDIAGLSDGFHILNFDGTLAVGHLSPETVLGLGNGFKSTTTDGGEIIEFYIRYEPNSVNMTLGYDYLMQLGLTSTFSTDNLTVLQQATVVTPDLDTLMSTKDIGVIVKAVNSEADYTYTGQYQTGFVLDTAPNENIVYTGTSNSTVYGGLSNDTIYGNIGNDTLNGNKGNDTLSGGAGTNRIDGGDGTADTVSYDFVTKYSDDFIFANGVAIDPATGSAYANDAKGVVVDLQTGSATGKTVYDATADVTTGEALLNINDTLSTIEYVIGSKYDDTLRGDAGNNKLMGGEGNDTLEGRGGVDWLDGGAGNDWLIGSTNDYMIDGGDNTDTVDFSNNSNGIEVTLNNSANGTIKNIGAATATTIIKNVENIAGTQYKDILTGDNSNNLLIGGYDHSAVAVTPSDDTVNGGAGADTIVGDMMIDSVIAGDIYAGNDVLAGGSENDTIYGDSAPILSTTEVEVSADQSVEYLRNTQTDATLATVHGGNDTLMGGTGNNYLNGGSGFDTVDYSSSTVKAVVNLGFNGSAGSATGEGTDQLYNIENIIGSNYGDTLAGNELVNTIDGGAGSDWVDLSAATGSVVVNLDLVSGSASGSGIGSDVLKNIENALGSAYGDTFIGNASNNTLNGAGGSDWVDYSGVSSNDLVVNLANGTITGIGIGTDTLISIENVRTGGGNDTVAGNSGNNTLDGGGGIDTVDYSSSSSATIIDLANQTATGALTGNDTLLNFENVLGGSGNDTISGTSADNTLNGGGGSDWVDLSSATGSVIANLVTAIASGSGIGSDSLLNIENLLGSSYDDTLTGTLSGNTLDGSGGADTLDYTAQNTLTVDMGLMTIAKTATPTSKDYFISAEVIKTGIGNDSFMFGTMSDTTALTLDGGSGTDTIDYSSIYEGINITLDGANDATVIVGSVGSNDDVIRNIENVYGSKVNDTLAGDTYSNTLAGNEGDDTIVGTLDTVSDFYYGGSVSGVDNGIDMIDYTAATAKITLSVVSGSTMSAISSEIGTDILSGMDVFRSGSGADTLTGGSSSITIYGNLGADVITGSSVADLLYGDNATNSHTTTDGHNTIAGGAGNDTLYAGDVGDSLRGDAGNDTMYGGAGIDTLDYVTNNIAITALLNTGIINGDGSDVVDTATIEILRSGTGADVITGADSGVLATIYAGAGNDIINGGALDETIYGEAGNDTIRGGTGIDKIYGGANNELIYGGIDGDVVYGDNGTGNVAGTSDTLDFSDLSSALAIDMLAGTVNTTDSTFSEIENITGGSGDDQITGDANANTLKGGAGNDTIFTSDGIDFIDGGSGTADVVDFSAITTAAINVNLSTLQIINDGYGKAETIQNIEIINGGNYTTAGDTLYGDGLDNIIYGNLGADQLSGNDGADVLYGDNATNSNGGADGHNTLDGGAGNDTLYAGDSGDSLIGGSGIDKIYGAAGADTLVGGAGDDTLDGGGGIDVADYKGAAAKIVIASVSANVNDTTDLTTGVLSAAEGTDIITNTVEVIYGSSGYGDTMTGNANANIFYGWGGNDLLSGGLGNDTIYGGSGDDTVAGNGGSDLLVGGDIIGTLSGWDTVDYSTDVAGVTVNLTAGTATDGSAGSDTLSGFSKVLGSSFADTITGNVGADDLRGGAGDDWIIMTAGNDTIYGGTTSETAGDTVDFIGASSAGIIVNLATNNASGTDIGTDVIYEIENVSGSNFADTITGDTNANILVGRALNDTIVAGAGADVIYGDDNLLNANFDGIQTGNDSLYGQDGNDTMYGGLGIDSLWGGNNDDTLYGGTGDDYLNGENGINVLYGNDGNDSFELNVTTATNTITGGASTDTLNFYYAGAATIDLSLATAQATGGGGSVMLSDSIENVVGSNGGADAITGNALANTIWSYNGNDLVYGAGGVDIIYGGAGADRLYGDTAGATASDGGNTIYGGEGNDTLYGGYGNDFLYGDDGGAYGTTCNDTLVAMSGSDGSDVLDGGQGTDTADYTAVSNNISVTLNGAIAATVTVTGGDNDTVVNVENFIGGSGNDNIIGDSNGNYLNGGAGNDTLLGGGGADILTDTVGTNTFAGGAGNDTITGIAATSWLDYSIDGILEGATTNLNTTIGQAISANRGSDTIATVNHITGSAYGDNFYGNSSVNTINGGDGNDTIEGYGGSDILDGGNNTAAGDTVTYVNENKINVTLLDGGAATNVGVWNGTNFTTEVDIVSNFENIAGSNSSTAALNSDTISGNSSANTIWGYAGNDLLYGAGGNDVLDGGESNDTIAGGTGVDNILGGNGNDVLRGGGTAYNSANTADGSADTLYGNAGDDTLFGMLDGDTLYGGDSAAAFSGNDRIDYSELAAGAVYIDINATVGQSFAQLVGTPATTDTIYGFDTVIGSNGNDTIVGNVNGNLINSGTGDDVIYMSPIATASSSANGGSDNIDMGTGNDTLYVFASELTSADVINGGADTSGDTIVFKDGGVINDPTKFSNVSNIEFVQFADVANTISLDTTKLNDVKLIGGTTTDIFNYAIANFDSHDSLDGGSGNDTLTFTSAGTLTDLMLSSISSIEKIQLASGTNNITVDISAISGTTLYSGASGTNTYNYSLGNLTNLDLIVGGGASTTDILQFLDAGTVADDTRFSGLTNFDQVKLANGTNTFNIGTNEAQLSGISLVGGTGIDTFVYASTAIADATANAKLIGSSGNDILKITGSTSVADANLSGFLSIPSLDVNSYTGSIVLGANATTMGIATIDASTNGGTLSINASAMTSGVTMRAATVGGSTYTGSNSAATDVLIIGSAITQDASAITKIETITVNADTTFTGDFSGVTTLTVASTKTLTVDASVLSGDTTTIANSGTVIINNAISGNSFVGLTFTGAGALQINGTNANDTITLNSTLTSYTGTITLSGGAGDDILTGSAKSDTLKGGAGNDILSGGAGSDNLDGGADDDTYRFTAAADVSTDVINDTGGGTDLIWTDANANFNLSTATATGIEGLKFYQAAFDQTDTISWAQASAFTTFTGFAGASDIVSVTGVTASLDMNSGKTYTNVSKVVVDASGASAAITLTGAAGVSNSITGGSGADIIVAGQLSDTLAGGASNDTFQFVSTYLTSADIVSDASGTADVLQITDAGATILASQLTGVTGVEILKLASDSTATMGGSFTSVNLSAGGTNIVNNSTVANITITGGAGTDTLNISGGVAINASNITNTEAINITSGSSAITGTFAGTPTITIASGATLSDSVAATSAKTLNINGTLTETNINALNISNFSLNSGGTANLTLASGGTLDASVAGFTKNSGGALKINGSTGAETITIDSAKFGTNANDSITDGGGTDTLIIKGASAIDFTKIAAMETVDLTDYTGTTLTTNTTTGETVKINSNYTSINTGGGTDQLYISANTVDLSASTLSGIESYYVNAGATLKISVSDVASKAVTGGGNIIVMMASSSAADLSAIAVTGTKTLEITANSTFTGTIGSISSLVVDNSVSATISASVINGKTIAVSGAGALDITANATAANNNFSGLTNAISGDVTLNVTSALDLSAINIGTAASFIDKINTTAALTLSGAQINAISKVSGTANVTIEAGAVSVDLSAKTLTGYSGAFIVNDGSGVQTLTGTGNADTFNLDNASASVVAGLGDDTVNLLSTLASSPTGTIDGGGGAGDVLNITKSGLTINASNITGIETINVNQSTTLTGTLNTTAVHIATGTTLTADASVVSAKVINNLTTNGTVAVTNLQGTLAADLSTITTTTIGATWSGSSATFTGNLGNASLAVTGGVMTTTDEILSGHTVTGSGALIVNVDSDLAFNWSNINSTVNETVNFSAGMTYAQNLSSADALTLASGVTVDISGATINGAITTSVTGAAGSESLTLNSSFLHATSSIDLAASADTLAITSNTALSAADFGKIHGVETLNLTNYTGTADLTSTDVNEITTLQTGSNVNSITIDYAMNVTDTGGTDTLTLAANSIDLSGKTITGIETLALGATTGTTLNATEASSMNIMGSGTNAFSISDSGGADAVNLTNDLSGFSGTFSFNGGSGNDSMTLDFTKLGSLTMDGGDDTDTLALSGLSGSHITAANMSNISNVETVDISSIDLSSASLTIDFNALWNLGLTSDLAQTGGYNTINLDVLGTDTTNLSIAGMTSPAFITTTGAYDITDGTNTLHMIVA